ncbi:hypothetical protein L195_g063338, partial [Trifolium pratense]
GMVGLESSEDVEFSGCGNGSTGGGGLGGGGTI